MMLTIHGLPQVASYQDVRTLLQRECNLNDFILDSLVNEKGNCKKVRIGVADETEGAHVIKCLDGFRCGGKMLYVVPVGKSALPHASQPSFEPRGNFQRNEFPPQGSQYGQTEPTNTGVWGTNSQWTQNQQQMGGFNYQQQNVPFQQTQPHRPLNERELMLQASRAPVSGPFQGGSATAPQKNPVPPPARPALRNIETVDLPKSAPGRYQDYEQPKPITIKKDNFMGPNQFAGSSNTQGQYPQSQPSWQGHGPQHKSGNFGKPNQPYDEEKKYLPKAGILKNPLPDRRETYIEKSHFTPQRRESPVRRMPTSDHRMATDHKTLPQDHRRQDEGMPLNARMQEHRMAPNHPGPGDRRMPVIDDRRMPLNDDRRMQLNDDRRPQMNEDRRPQMSDDRRPQINDDRRPQNDDRRPQNDDRRPQINDDRRPQINDDRRPQINDDRRPQSDRRMPNNDRMGPNDRRMTNDDRMGPNDRRMQIDSAMGPNDRRMPVDDRMGPNNRKMQLNDDRMGPNEHRMGKDERLGVPHSGRRMSPMRRVSPVRRDGPMGTMGRQISPPRRLSPSGRRLSPSARRMSPGRRMSPSGRRMSPSARRVSPPGRHMSPGRHVSPTNKRISPDRRLRSPGRRSPNRRPSPDAHGRQMRYSPSRHMDKGDPRGVKQVRPAYEADSKATSQAMYSGGYRPGMHEPVSYVVPGAERISPWHDAPGHSRETYGGKKEEDRRDRVSRLSDRSDLGEKRMSPSRSPLRAGRRHSPSPRSPRRSWALEKRRSPDHDAPPPPSWPGQQEYNRQATTRKERPDKEVKPIWEKPFVKMEDRERDPEFEIGSVRVRKDLAHNVEARALPPPRREPSPHRFKETRRDERFTREPKFEPREPKFEPREPKFEREEFPHDRRFPEHDRKKIPDREEFIARSERVHQEFKKKEEISKHQPPRPAAYHRKHEEFEDEFQDIYKRAVDFAKKTQELRKHDRRKDQDDIRDDSARHGREFYERNDYRDERPRSRHSDEYRHKRESKWEVDPRKRMDPNNLAKREKAVDEITKRIIQSYIDRVEPEMRSKVITDLKDRIFLKIYEMYEDKDISYIELLIKFNTRFDHRAEEKLFHEAATKYSVQYRGTKRSAPDASEIPQKTIRRSPKPNEPTRAMTGANKPLGTIISDWTADPVSLADQMAVQQMYGAQQILVNQYIPVMPTLPTYPVGPVPAPMEMYQPNQPTEDGFHLYLCKADLNLFLSHDVNELKEFVVSEIFNTTAVDNWAPSFVFKGLQTPHRYELVTQDPQARDWLLALDFSGFSRFSVVVYNSEELWYERVAIWLPGHSKCRYIEPFKKLQLQNRKLEGVDIGKWKFVKSIVTAKGTRLYVDVPPSVARILETKKTLSYELQQVSVFLKAVAVDKAVFDSGLNEPSVVDEATLLSAIQTSPMPILKNEIDFVKITIKGYKNMSITDARKIKDMLVFELFKYLRLGGQSSTDFVKYGICMPCYFGVVPANEESKKWLTQLNMGNLYKRPIVVMGGDEEHVKRILLKAYISGCKTSKNIQYVFERLKFSNKGVKGLHFNLWRPDRLEHNEYTLKFLVRIDMESVETLASLNFTLDYLDEHCDNDVKTVTFRSDVGEDRLYELIREYKAEQHDTFEVSNMVIESSDTDDDIICLGEATDED